MITCKLCGNQEYYGSYFCSECGSQLVGLSDQKVNTLVYPSQIKGLNLDITDTIPKEMLNKNDFLLFAIESKELITLPEQNEFTMGRYVEGQVITPDVDLNKDKAYDKGISRLHATIRLDPEQNKAYVIDLGSANGSSVNGYEIPSHSEVPLNHGDVLSLGKFKLKVILPDEVE